MRSKALRAISERRGKLSGSISEENVLNLTFVHEVEFIFVNAEYNAQVNGSQNNLNMQCHSRHVDRALPIVAISFKVSSALNCSSGSGRAAACSLPISPAFCRGRQGHGSTTCGRPGHWPTTCGLFGTQARASRACQPSSTTMSCSHPRPRGWKNI